MGQECYVLLKLNSSPPASIRKTLKAPDLPFVVSNIQLPAILLATTINAHWIDDEADEETHQMLEDAILNEVPTPLLKHHSDKRGILVWSNDGGFPDRWDKSATYEDLVQEFTEKGKGIPGFSKWVPVPDLDDAKPDLPEDPDSFLMDVGPYVFSDLMELKAQGQAHKAHELLKNHLSDYSSKKEKINEWLGLKAKRSKPPRRKKINKSRRSR